jgi:hypothetical protein
MLPSVGYGKDQDPVEKLLDELCVDMGFCIPPYHRARIQPMPTADVDAFAKAVFEAEGLLEPFDRHLWSEVRDRVGRDLTGLG